MNDTILRYQHNPAHTDTVGFFDVCIPLINKSGMPVADSLKKFYFDDAFDYVTPPPVPRQFLETISVFGKHNLGLKHSGPLAIERQTSDWITIVFIACLLALAWIQTIYPKRLTQIFRAVAQPHFINQLEREGNLFRERITLGLGFIYYMISSIFVYQIFNEFILIPSGLSNLAFTGMIFSGLFLYQMLKSIVVYSSGVVFATSEHARFYQLNILIFNHMIGVILIPVTILAFYGNSALFLTAGIIIISILLTYRLFRGILTGLANKNYNLFYLFLYLCTLEILPLILLFKVMSKV